jgi:hypothetical protein
MSRNRFRRSVAGIFPLALLHIGIFIGWPAAAQTPRNEPSSAQAQPTLVIPYGTILPVRLNHGLSSKNAKVGQTITARIMQEVPLPNRSKIPEGTKMVGTIVAVRPAGAGSSGNISFRFERLLWHQQSIPIVASLRALAGFMEVQDAQTPEFTPGFGTPYNWATTQQIGGDEVYGVGGPVTDQWSQTVGKGVNGGVLVHVRAQPGSKCRGALDPEDRLQALWVFSSDACGVYGIAGVAIEHAGRSEPVGEVRLTAAQGDVRVRGASAMLLRILR